MSAALSPAEPAAKSQDAARNEAKGRDGQAVEETADRTADEKVTEPKPASKAKPVKKFAKKFPSDYRSAKWPGGQGVTWRTGRDAYGFAGAFGGCVYRGSASPAGYHLDQIC